MVFRANFQVAESFCGAFCFSESRPCGNGVCCVAAMPKTRSGKIMRRVLRKIAAREEDSLGDTSTLADPGVVDQLLGLRAPLKT